VCAISGLFCAGSNKESRILDRAKDIAANFVSRDFRVVDDDVRAFLDESCDQGETQP